MGIAQDLSPDAVLSKLMTASRWDEPDHADLVRQGRPSDGEPSPDITGSTCSFGMPFEPEDSQIWEILVYPLACRPNS